MYTRSTACTALATACDAASLTCARASIGSLDTVALRQDARPERASGVEKFRTGPRDGHTPSRPGVPGELSLSPHQGQWAGQPQNNSVEMASHRAIVR